MYILKYVFVKRFISLQIFLVVILETNVDREKNRIKIVRNKPKNYIINSSNTTLLN